ncbi:MAG: Hvo_1808 family surface protein [Halobacteriales archaeon]
MRHRAGLLAVALAVLAAGCFGLAAPGGSPGQGTGPAGPGAGSPDLSDSSSAPPDPRVDHLGWEDGYWYDESVPVDRNDGLNDSELYAVVSRSMARIERIREIEFETRVSVEVVSREAYAADRTRRNYSTRTRLHANAKWEAAFVVDESTDALATRDSNRAASVGGFYRPGREKIVIVSENATTPRMNEITLAQELFHALQDQAFDAFSEPWYPGRTIEGHNAADGIIEGDGNYVDHLYQRRCEGDWDCLLPRPGNTNGSGDNNGGFNLGMFAVTFHPYSSGPAFVKRLHEREGWEAVNDLYEDPFGSSAQLIHPRKYGEDAPEPPEIDHTASNGWRVLDMGEGRVDYASFGEAGLAVMLWYPSAVETRERGTPTNVIVNYTAFFRFAEDGGGLRSIGPYNYDFPVTAGWDGDRLVPYVTDDSASTNETGYVWKIRWETRGDAVEFREGYEALLAYHGAEPVPGRADTYRISEGEAFADAFHVRQDGRTITIVNAPTVADLGDIHGGAGDRT